MFVNGDISSQRPSAFLFAHDSLFRMQACAHSQALSRKKPRGARTADPPGILIFYCLVSVLNAAVQIWLFKPDYSA